MSGTARPFHHRHFFDVGVGVLDVLLERLIKLADHGHPFFRAFRDLVQFGFHACREVHVHDVAEVFHQHVVDDEAHFRGCKRLSCFST